MAGSMRKIRIDKSDKYRVLLTDVLPYETPIFFSNEGFHRFSKDHLAESAPVVRRILTTFEDGQKNDVSKIVTIPYSYDIRKGTLGTRTLSLFHPAVQLQIVGLYENFSHVILHLCKRSQFSLRYPAAIASVVYEKEDEAEDTDEVKHGATFFKYEKYDFLYRFYESYELQRLEKRFRHLRLFDISKCFNHIYTHTLSWAVRSKEFAKGNLGSKTVDGEFDAIMQAANHKETAGILIGSEVSRIFAEIILQKVDISVERRLAVKLNRGMDYDIRRYVDDYYVFSRTKEIGEKVMRIYLEELKMYRLYFNESKSIEMVVPFMTTISCAKVELGDILNTFFESLITKIQPIDGIEKTTTILLQLKSPNKKASRLIQQIKSIIKSHGVEFSSVSGFIFSVFEKRLIDIVKTIDKENTSDRELGNFLYVLLDVIFFVYAMDVRVSITYKVGRTAIKVCETVSGRSDEINELIRKKIFDEARRILDSETLGQPEFYVETVNLLAVIRMLGPEYHVTPEIIDRMIEAMDRDKTEDDTSGIDYFLVAAILFHIGNNEDYSLQKKRLLQKTIERFETEENHSQRTDFTCLFFDLLSCPFLENKFKRQLTQKFKINGTLLSDKQRGSIMAEVPIHQWFTDWQARDNIEILLLKKKYQAPY